MFQRENNDKTVSQDFRYCGDQITQNLHKEIEYYQPKESTSLIKYKRSKAENGKYKAGER